MTDMQSLLIHGHDFPRYVDELAPGEATGVEISTEDLKTWFVRRRAEVPVVAQELPDISAERHEGDGVWNRELRRGKPPGLIEKNERTRAERS
jgi:hypothetical protein